MPNMDILNLSFFENKLFIYLIMHSKTFCFISIGTHGQKIKINGSLARIELTQAAPQHDVVTTELPLDPSKSL